MKDLTGRMTSVCWASLLVAFAATAAMGQDAVKVAPNQYKVQFEDAVKVAPDKYKMRFENEKVRVLEYRDKPGDKSEMHTHPDFVVYFISSSKRRFTFPDGRTVEVEAQAPGTVAWRNATTHAGENIGTNEEHVLLIELKEPAK